MRIVVCLTTFDRIDCARINQELIKLNYRQALPIVHACSSPAYAPYLEDRLIPCEPKPINEGSVELLLASMQHAVDALDADYLVHLEADTWLLDESVIHRLVHEMALRSALLCASGWGVSRAAWFGWSRFTGLRWVGSHLRPLVPGARLPCGVIPPLTEFGTQFFILHREALPALMSLQASETNPIEQAFHAQFCAHHGLHRVLPIVEREPVHPANRYSCEALSLYAQHWPARGLALDPRPPGHLLYVPPSADGKREVLQRHLPNGHGTHLQRLLQAEDLAYYNPGALRY